MFTRKAFTLVELMVVMGIFALLATLTSITLINSQNHANSSATIDSLITDIRQQQLKAIVGDRTINSSAVAGVHFQAASYTLFQAPTYAAADPGNFTVPLPSVLTFTTTFPAAQILFASASGAIIGFSSGSNTVTVVNTQANEQKVITFNKYGVIISVN